MRQLWFVTGLFCVGLGTIGIFLPLMPTVVFMILAAFCFARSSDRWHRWLVDHPVYGPHIRDWQETGAIRPRVKRVATVSIVAAFLLSVLLGLGAEVLTVQAVVLTLVLAFIWSRPPG